MKLRSQLGVLIWIAISGIVCVDCIRTGIGTFRVPGSGFFPFWLGVILCILALVHAVGNLLKGEKGKIADLWKGKKWGQTLLVMVVTLIYSILLTKLGYLITTFLLLTILFCLGERKRVWAKATLALIIVLASYLFFHDWLKAPLPEGVFSF